VCVWRGGIKQHGGRGRGGGGEERKGVGGRKKGGNERAEVREQLSEGWGLGGGRGRVGGA
jgi:hypothetical protein